MTIYGFHKLTSTLKSMEGINSDERYFEGLLTVQMKDKQGEVTIVDELYKVLPVWIDRGAPISDTHSNRIVGKGINYSRTTVKNGEGHELPAIKITGKIFKNYELDNVIWNKIKNNEYKGLSFGGATRSARSPIKMKDGSTAYALSDLEHYEVAVCADPAVPMAIITDFNQIAKANFNSSVRDDGKMVIQCDKMGCYVNKIGGGGIGGGDLLTVMEGDKPENYNAVENGKKRGRPIDKTEPTGMTDRELKLWREIQEDDKEDSDNQYYTKGKGDFCPNCGKHKKMEMGDMTSMGGACPNCGHGFKEKFMEKKEMLDATLGNKEEKRPTQSKRDMRETETSGYKPDLEKAIEIINKAGYKVDTEDRNNGTGINDVEREIPAKKLPIKGSLSQELPTQIQQADLNESQTFEQKVQALMAEGKSRESAEKIVGSFVHKVEASSGSGGAGIGDSNNSNGGTLTTQTGGANNPIHNSKCQCDKCRSKGLDISNTGSGGTTEGAFNQNPPNAQRLNNKSDDVNKDSLIKIEDEKDENTKVEVLDEWKHEKHPDAKEKADDEEIVEAPEVEEEERPEWAWLMNHKSKATREVNKVHALMKLNNIRKIKRNPTAPKSTQNSMANDVNNYNNWSKLQAGVQGHRDIDSQEYSRRLQINATRAGRGMTDKYPMPPRTGLKQTKRTVGASRTSLGGGSGKGDGALGKSIGDGKQAKPRSRNPSRDDAKKPHDKHGKDDDHEKPPTPKIRYSRGGGDNTPRQIRQSLDELRKLSTFKAPPEKHRKRVTVEDIISHGKKEREEAEKRVRELKIGALEKVMTYQNTRGNVEMKYPTEGEEVWDSKQQKRVKETKTPKRTMALEKALAELKKLQISGGLGSRGLGSEHGYTQGQQESTQVTLVQPRPEDDRVQSKRTTKEPKKQQL